MRRSWLYLKDFLSCSLAAEKLKLQEELFRLRSHRKDGEAKKEHLLNRAKVLQARAASHKAKVNTFFTQLKSIEKGKAGIRELSTISCLAAHNVLLVWKSWLTYSNLNFWRQSRVFVVLFFGANFKLNRYWVTIYPLKALWKLLLKREGNFNNPISKIYFPNLMCRWSRKWKRWLSQFYSKILPHWVTSGFLFSTWVLHSLMHLILQLSEAEAEIMGQCVFFIHSCAHEASIFH